MNKIFLSLRFLLLVLILSALILQYGCGQEKQKRLNIGDKAPDFNASSLQGQQISLTKYKGSPVIMRFFTIDCKYCQIDTPLFNTFYNQYKEQGLKMVYINTDENSEGINQFIEGTGITFPVVLDPDHSIAGNYSVVKVPLTIILNSQHIVSAALLGGVGEEQLLELLKNYISIP
jgi:peroxiredoxin